MTSEQPNMRRDALLNRALISKGHRPATAAGIDQFLGAIDAAPMTDEKKQRMLRKINGQEPVFVDRSTPPPLVTTELSECERELAAMYRAQNRPLPPDLAAKIKSLEDRATNRGKPGQESPGG